MTKTLPQIIASLEEGESISFQAVIGKPVIDVHFTKEYRCLATYVGIQDIECARFGLLEDVVDNLITRMRLSTKEESCPKTNQPSSSLSTN